MTSGNGLTDGPPLRVRWVDQSSSKDERVQRYADKLVAEIKNLEEKLKGISLDCRVAFLLPPNQLEFMTELSKTLSETLSRELRGSDAQQPKYTLINAEHFAKRVGQGGEGSSSQQLVLDTVDNFNGLESLITFGVHLDGPYPGDLQVRSWLYRSITRTQMLCVLVSEQREGGGWLQWLNFTQHDPKNKLDASEREMYLSATQQMLLMVGVCPSFRLSRSSKFGVPVFLSAIFFSLCFVSISCTPSMHSIFVMAVV
jgi:hypothetical protein